MSVLLSGSLCVLADNGGQGKKILLVHSFEPFLPYNITVNRSIRSTLEADRTAKTDLYVEYLDLSRFPGEGYRRRLAGLLRYKYSSRSLDMIFVMLNPALDFITGQEEELFPGVPVVFCSIEKHQLKDRSLKPNVTGVLMEVDPKGTLDAALRLQPGTKRVIVVGGATKNDRAYEGTVRQAFGEYKGRLDITYLTGVSMETVLKTVSGLPEDTIILYITMFQDGTGKSFVPAEVAAVISRAANAPVYGMFDSYFGQGIVGGHMVSFREQGKKVAQMGLDILHGRKPPDMPVSSSPNVYQFDWRQMKRWGMSDEGLPPGSVVAYRKMGLWDQYKWLIVGIIAFCTIESLLIFVLLMQRIMRRKAADALHASEEKYRNIFENSIEGIFQTTPDGRILSVNPALARIYGYDSPREMIADISDIDSQLYVTPGDRRKFIELIEKNGVVEAFEIQEYRKDGSKVWVSLAARAVRDKNGAIYCYEGTAEDITLRKQAEEELLITHRRLFDIIEFLPDATFVIDREKKVVAWNRACEEMTGVNKEEMIGKGDYSYAAPFYGERRPMLIDHVAIDSGSLSENYRSITRKGDALHAEAFVPKVFGGKGGILSGNASPLFDKDGNMVGAIESVRDITELRHLETQLRQSQKMEAIGTLAGGVAHDFNNILTTIIGYANLLQMDMDDEDPQMQYIDQILASSQKAADLTQSLLAFSRKQTMRLRPCSLGAILKGIENLLKRLLTEDIEFKTILADPDVIIMADANQVDQILINLATNARDAMPKGGKLVIKAEGISLDSGFVEAHGYGKPGSYGLISVEDTGCGLDEAIREKIFEPFFTTKEIGRGTGLGLSIVYGIVKQHNGYINVYSETGKGSVFRIYLPAAEGREEKFEQTLHRGEAPGGNETILVGEDNEESRSFLKELLTRKGYTVIEATDGEDAVEKFMENKNDIDLLILDVVMPRKNGKDAYEDIRKIRTNMKVLFASGYTGDILPGKGMEGEPVDFIAKPILPGELLVKIREILDR